VLNQNIKQTQNEEQIQADFLKEELRSDFADQAYSAEDQISVDEKGPTKKQFS